MEEEKRPLHSPEHFKSAVDRIVEYEGQKDMLWWLEVRRLGLELQDSVEGGTIDESSEDNIKQEMSKFMEKGNNENEYKDSLADKADIWWKNEEVK